MHERFRNRIRAFRKRGEGIRAKLFLGFALLMALVLGIVFAAILALDLKRANHDLSKAQGSIRNAIFAKGKHIAMNYAIALGSLAEENSVSAIRDIVGNTVNSDPDVAYGIFMDTERRPWAFHSRLDSSSGFDPRTPLGDSMSLWASRIRSMDFRTQEAAGTEIIEFAAPVRVADEVLGMVRFGFTTEAMNAAIREAGDAARMARRRTFLLFTLIAVITFFLAMLASGYQAARITRPITALTASASRMARGDYGFEVKPMGADEFAVLAGAFETMRLEIRNYMENLQTLVEEKVRQIRDILENIDQGVFSFDLDMRIDPDSSRKAKDILQTEDLAGRTLAEVLKLDPEQERSFRDWLEIARDGHAGRRWSKLSRLAPMREIQLGAGEAARHLQLEYQKVLDKQGRLARIMVLVSDETETRLIKRRMLEEKVRHEHRVKTVLGVASHSQETISEFLKDTEGRLRSLEKRMRENPARAPGAEAIAGREHACRECHTIKGNAGAFGFESLMQAAQDLETVLQGGEAGSGTPSGLSADTERLVARMREEAGKIAEIHVLLAGNAGEVSVKVPEAKVSGIKERAEALETRNLAPDVLLLVEHCKRITFRSLVSLTRKYQELVDRAAGKLGKTVAFSVSPGNIELDPEALFLVDEALVHLLRNAVAHGIEPAEVRRDGNKGPGRVELSYSRGAGEHVFMVRDDGRGIDSGALAAKAVALGLLTEAAAAGLGEKEKLDLIFHPGLTTSAFADSLSGRGLGMSIAVEAVLALSGSLTLETWPGSGTRFAITIPG